MGWWGLQPQFPGRLWFAFGGIVSAGPFPPQQPAAGGGSWVQLPRQQGTLCRSGKPGLMSCAAEPRRPVVITTLGRSLAWEMV